MRPHEDQGRRRSSSAEEGCGSRRRGRELIECLLGEERLIWPEHEPLTPTRFLRPMHNSCQATRMWVGSAHRPPEQRNRDTGPRVHRRRSRCVGLGVELDSGTQLRFEALSHGISISCSIGRHLSKDRDPVAEPRTSVASAVEFNASRPHRDRRSMNSRTSVAIAFALGRGKIPPHPRC